MKNFLETDRLLLREILPSDVQGIYELNSDANVLTYLHENPFTSIKQAEDHIAHIRRQYEENGIGRWAVIQKSDERFLGWAGLKLRKEPFMGLTEFHDLGYRFIRQYWGKGYASEVSLASVKYAFDEMKLEELYAMADTRNLASIKVLEKVGMKRLNTVEWEGVPHEWFKLTAEQWRKH